MHYCTHTQPPTGHFSTPHHPTSTFRTGHTGIDVLLSIIAPLLVTWLFGQGMQHVRDIIKWLLKSRPRQGEYVRTIEYVRATECWFMGSDDHSGAMQRCIERFLNDKFVDMINNIPSTRVKVEYMRPPLHADTRDPDSECDSDYDTDDDSEDEMDWRKYRVSCVLAEDQWVKVPGWSVSVMRYVGVLCECVLVKSVFSLCVFCQWLCVGWVCVGVCSCVCLSVCVFTYVYVCLYTCMCSCACTPTHCTQVSGGQEERCRQGHVTNHHLFPQEHRQGWCQNHRPLYQRGQGTHV